MAGKKASVLESRVSLQEKAKELGGLFFVLCATFIFISLISYDPGDLREIRYPPNAPLMNKGGAIGARVSYGLFSSLGLASYLLVILTGFWAFVVFFRRRLKGLYVKLTAAAVSVLATATLLSLQPVFSTSSFGLSGTAPGLGGIYGQALDLTLVSHLGAAGAWLAVILALGVSLVLSTDWMIYTGVLRLARLGAAVLNRITHRYTPEERARRQEIARQADIERAKANLAARRQAAVATPQAAPAPPAPAPQAAGPVMRPKPVTSDPIKAEAAKFDNRKLGPYEQPPIDIFESKIETIHGISEKEIKDRMLAIEGALKEYGIDGRVVNYDVGPAVTTYEVELAAGQPISAITARQEEITMRLATLSVRVVAPLPGKGTVGVEVPNQ